MPVSSGDLLRGSMHPREYPCVRVSARRSAVAMCGAWGAGEPDLGRPVPARRPGPAERGMPARSGLAGRRVVAALPAGRRGVAALPAGRRVVAALPAGRRVVAVLFARRRLAAAVTESLLSLLPGQRLDQPVDLGGTVRPAPARSLGVDRGTQVAEHGVGPPPRLGLIKHDPALLGGFLGLLRKLGGLLTHPVHQSHRVLRALKSPLPSVGPVPSVLTPSRPVTLRSRLCSGRSRLIPSEPHAANVGGAPTGRAPPAGRGGLTVTRTTGRRRVPLVCRRHVDLL